MPLEKRSSRRGAELPIVVIGAGQSGLAAARVLDELNVATVVLESGDRPAGSWPSYYDSLRAFSPAEFSSMPGMPFPGDAGRYPTRDEVVDYLVRYAAELDVEIRTGTHVVTVRQDDSGFRVVTDGGHELRAAGIVAASGSFSNPHRPSFSGQKRFTAELSHVADYRNPRPYVGKRVIVVGAGDSAAQVAVEVAAVGRVTVATRHPLQFIPQRIGDLDVHHWLRESGFDSLPSEWLRTITSGSVITDSVGFEERLARELLDVRPMFVGLDRDQVMWSADERERVDAVILATGYRPSVAYLRELGALDHEGAPLHVGGLSTTHPGLVYLGIEFQRSYASNTLRGVSADATAVIDPLVAWVRDAAGAVGLTS